MSGFVFVTLLLCDATNGKNVRWPTIGRHTCPEVSTSSFCDSPGPPPLVDALGYVPAHRQGEQNGRQVWYFFVVFLWHSTPLSVPGNTVRILARWRRPVASCEALNTLYRSISAVSCRRIISSVKTGRTEVHSFVVDDRAIDLNLAY
jgi:hypothetical protein